jgi:thioredoxin reductase/bacterioferritin-associated ferredoxin
VKRSVDVAVIGGGPAGLAAATLTAQHGLSTLLIDDQRGPGGQIYRNVMASLFTHPQALGDDYLHGVGLIDAFRTTAAGYLGGATVFAVTKAADGGCEVVTGTGEGADRHAEIIHAQAVILATGAQERPFAIRGWTLPGVMTIGAAQVLLKSSGLVPDGRVVLAGTGPLLWLLASQYLRTGVKIDLLLDTTAKGRYAEAASHALGFLTSDYFSRGFRLLREGRARVKVVEHVTALAALGDERLTSVRYELNDTTHEVAADVLLLHQGVVPNLDLARSVGCTQRWNELQKCWEPVVDDWGGSSVPNVFIAGDGATVAGAEAAAASGRLAALAVANALGRIDAGDRERGAKEPRQLLQHVMRGRRFFDTLYRPAHYFRIPRDDAVICRCEEVTARQVVDAVAAGCPGPNQLKAFLRCGAGPCQGRMCSLSVTEIMARERKLQPAEVGSLRGRFPARPLTLGELAAMPTTDEATRAADDARAD